MRGLAWGGLQAHTQGEVEGSGLRGGLQARTQGGKLRGLAWGGLQAHTQGEVEGSGLGGSPGPHLEGLQVHTGKVSQHALKQVRRRLLLRAVRILLECILVLMMFVNLKTGCQTISRI